MTRGGTSPAVVDRGDLQALAWSSAKSFALVSTVGSLIAAVAWHLKSQTISWPWYGALAVTASCLTLVMVRRSLPSRASTAIFLICTAAVLFASGYSNNVMAEVGVRFEAFSGYKVVAFAVALLAPTPVWTGFLVVSICGIAPILQYFLLAPGLRAVFAVQEPWAALVYAVIAGFLLRYRLHRVALAASLTRLESERRALNDLARILLGLRDLTNTPLQSIEMTARLLGGEHLSATEASTQLEKSLVRLRELSKLMAAYEKNVDWTRTEMSFDAVSSLQKQLEGVARRKSI